MAIPVKSSKPVVGRLLSPDGLPKRPTIDFEMGGVGLQDTSMGLTFQQWRAWFDRNEGGVFVESPNTPPTLIFEQEGIEWLSFCFDQNMRWSAVYTLEDGNSYLRWYNSQIADYEVLHLEQGVISPFLTLDEKRAQLLSSSDIVLAYIKNQTLILRVQRERFSTAHIWQEDIPKGWIIRNFGMSNKLRLQMEIR